MLRMLTILVVLMASFARAAQAQDDFAAPDDLPMHIGNFRLDDLDGVSHELHDWADAKAVVLLIQGNACPIVRQTFPYFMEIRDEFEPHGVKFALINSNAIDDIASIKAELDEFGVDLLALKDSLQAVARSLHSERTAEAFLIDPATWDIVYRGEADDRFGYGLQRSNPQNFYLKDALTSWLNDRSLPETRVRITKGCLMDLTDLREDVDFTEDVKPVLRGLCATCNHDDPKKCVSAWDVNQAEMHTKMLWETLLMQRKPATACCEAGQELSISEEEALVLISWLRNHEPAARWDDVGYLE